MIKSLIDICGDPRDWPPEFPDDVALIVSVLADFDIQVTSKEAQSFWEEVSDPDGWTSPEKEDIYPAYKRIMQIK